METPVKKNKVIIIFFLIFLGVFISLFLVEITIRLFLPMRSTLIYYDNKIFGNALVPNQTGLFVTQSHEYFSKVTTNSEGWPDVEHTKEKEPGVYRILIIGDSFVENFQVPFDKRFFRQLQDKLDKKIEIIAMGRGNTGTAEQYLILKNYGLTYHPDLVIQMFLTANDIKNNSFELQQDSRHPYFNLDKNNTLVFISQIEPNKNFSYQIKNVLKQSRLVEFILSVRQKFQEMNTIKKYGFPIDYGIYLKNESPEYTRAWNITKKIILESKKETEKSGAKYILVSLSNNEQANDDVWQKVLNTYTNMKPDNFDLEKPDSILKTFCTEEKIDCSFMNPFYLDYIKNNPKTRTHFFYDGHWNETGTNLAAEFLRKNIEDYLTIK